MNSQTYEILLALGVLAPFISFWVLVFFGPKMGKPASGWFAVVLGMGVPLVLATVVLFGWLGAVKGGEAAALTAQAAENVWTWAMLGSVPATLGVKLDSLTVGMYFMVAFVAFWIFFFSIGYMSGHSDEVAHKRKYWRFFAYLSLFGFSMLGLVVSSSLLFLFIFWELVGLCSYLLIGFYFDQRWPQYAQMKAFIVNRVGDFGFLIGLMLVYFHLGTLDLDEAAARFAEQYANGTGLFASKFTFLGWTLPTIMGIGLFCGAMGKSAQFPLHVWLPDAMAGPTPVSALIHAATMVAAGVYLVARVFRLMTPEALMFIGAIGCITLTLMALVAIVQTDIKKCLAYSTLSQLGYMIFGMGCGAWVAALFHLITHAFFKAMLFLGSGQVIEGCHHVQDMRKMGGLSKKMPVTCWTFFIGVLAIAGTGIPGIHLGIGGYFSKDEILAVAYARTFEWNPEAHEAHAGIAEHGSEPRTSVRADDRTGDVARDPSRGRKSAGTFVPRTEFSTATLASDPIALTQHTQPDNSSHDRNARNFEATFKNTPPLPKWMFWLAIITAYVTPFYMFRCWWMTFMGKPRDEHVHHHAHEIPLMYVPLIVLAVGTLWSSYFLFRPLFADAAVAATAAPMVLALDGTADTPAIHHAHSFLVFGVGFAFLIGFAAAFAIYRNGLALAERIKSAVWPVALVLEKKYYFDEVYDFVFVKGCLLIAGISRFIDTWIVDLAFNILASGTERIAAFSGNIIDKYGVDGMYNGVSKTALDVADLMRRPQTGRIRQYVLFAAGTATIVLAVVLWYGWKTATVSGAARAAMGSM
jgi:NADH-quinone oxidoreductase subunit L